MVAEQAVIGSILIGGDEITKVYGFLKPEDFYRESFSQIYSAILDLFNRGQKVDLITVSDELGRKGHLESVGGEPFLNNTVDVVPTSVNVEHYGRIVQRTATMRRLIAAADKIAEIGYEDDSDVATAMRRAENSLARVRAGQDAHDFVHIREILDRGLSELEKQGENGHSHLPLKTGFETLDSLIGGLHKSDMIVLAARPSVGKSMLALNIALAVAKANRLANDNRRNRVAIFSLEMSVEQVVTRLLSAQARVDQTLVRDYLTISKSDLEEGQEARLIDAIGLLSDLEIFIDDTPFQTVMEMRGKARQLELEHGIDFVVVDYMQLIDGGRSRMEMNRAQVVSEISRHMKGMARDVSIPVLALSQLNRAIEQRHTSPRPVLSDLRESGSIEQDADIVMFIHREDKIYTEEQWVAKHSAKSDQPYPKGVAKLIVAKHRNGPVGEITMVVREEIGRFHTIAPASPRAEEWRRHANIEEEAERMVR